MVILQKKFHRLDSPFDFLVQIYRTIEFLCHFLPMVHSAL